MDGDTERGFDSRAAEDGIIRAGARMGEDEREEGVEVVEAMGGSKGAGHPTIGRVIVAKAVDGGRPTKDMEIKMGESGVMMELLLEEGEERLRGEGRT